MKKELIALFLMAAMGSMAGTGTATKVVVQNQIEDQRLEYVGAAGELVFTTDRPDAPLAVFDGSTTGGVRLVSIQGAVPRVSTVAVTNDAEWVGWPTTGSLRADGLLYLDSGEWVESPRLTGGVNRYDVSGIYSDGGTSWSAVVYTNTTATPVGLPYTGTDARLRVSWTGFMGAPGATWEAGVKIPGIGIESFVDPSLLMPGRYVPNSKVVSPPTDPEQMARLDTVVDYHALATGYTDAEIVKYSKDTGKVVRGSMVFAGAGWAFSPTKSDTGATLQIAWGGFPMMDFLLGVAGCTIDTFATAGTTATFGIATNGVSTAPVVEYSTDLAIADWRPATVVSGSYPALVGGKYEIVIERPESETAYFRCLRRTSGSIQAFADITTPSGNSIDGAVRNGTNGTVDIIITNGAFSVEGNAAISGDVSVAGLVFHGVVGGTNRTATLRYDFDNDYWTTEVLDD